MPTHGMIDIETLSLKPDALVLQVAGAKFDPFGNKGSTSDEFCFKLNYEEQKEIRAVDDSTIQWWSRQDPDVIDKVFPSEDDPGMPVMDFLKKLKKWCSNCEVFWSQGSLDYIVLNNLHDQYSVSIPWKFWQCHDSRTILSRFRKDPRNMNSDNRHDAVDDCRQQISGLQLAYDKFNFQK